MNKDELGFILEMGKRMAEHAEAAMLQPKHDLFALGESAGQYQGMKKSLDLFHDILRDALQKEKDS